MKDVKNEKSITPATISQMQIGNRIQSYEDILRRESELRAELLEAQRPLEKLLRVANIHYNTNLAIENLVQYKPLPEDLDEDIRWLGDYSGTLLTNFMRTIGVEIKLEHYIGKEAVAKLKEVVEYHNTTRVREIDYKATKKLRIEYPKLVEKIKDKETEITALATQKEEARNYVSYVKDLADIAKTTSSITVNQDNR